MKKLLTIALLITSFGLNAQNDNPNYDAELAKKLDADDYGMKSYVLVMLKTGTNQDTTKVKRDESFRGHMNNIQRLVKANQMVVAGPLGANDKNYRGIFILNVKTVAEAEVLLATDSAIKNKYLEADLFPWYGSAALAEYLTASDKVWKIKP